MREIISATVAGLRGPGLTGDDKAMFDEVRDAAAAAQAAAGFASSFATVSKAAVVDRKSMFAQSRLDDAFQANTFGGLTYVALGSQLPDILNSYEIYISTTAATAAYLSFTLYSRPIAGAADDGGGHAGDTLEFSERRQIGTFVEDFARDGTINRIVYDSFHDVTVAADRMYLLVVHVLDADGAFLPFGSSRAQPPAITDPGYPQICGYRQDSPTDLLWRRANEVCFAIHWRSARFANGIETAASLAAISVGSRTFTVGAPLSLLSSVANVAAAGTWYNEYPLVQTGIVPALRCQSSGIGEVTFLFSRLRDDNSGLDVVVALTFHVNVGDNEFIAGRDFDPFIASEGLYHGIRQDVPLVVYSALGNNFYEAPNGAFTVRGGVTLSFSAMVVAEKRLQSIEAAKEPRVVLYDVAFDKTTAPLGWSTSPGATYTPDGMKLTNSAGSNSWQIGNYSHHWLACDKMVVRVEYQHIEAGSIFGIGAARDPQGPAEPDTTYLNSLFAIDTTVGAPRAYQAPSNFMTNPDGVLIGPNGLGGEPQIGDILTSEVKLDWGQFTHNVYNHNQATMADMTVAGERENPTDFGGPGLMVPYVSVHFKKGNVLVRRITMLYDGPPVDIFFAGDSMTKIAPPDGNVHQGYVGLVEADGYSVVRCAAPGWTSHGITKSAINMMRYLRPRRAMFAGGTNDYNQSVPVADFKWNVSRFIDEARRSGVEKIALAVLHPIPDPNNAAANGIIQPGITPYNQALFELAAGQPDIFLVRWDLALTVDADGVTPDTTKLYADRQHQIAKGELAKYQALRFGSAASFFD